MNTRVLAGVGVASVVLLASCMQDRGATPLLPTQASYSNRPVGGSCVAASTTNTNAKAYFTNGKDPVFALLDSLYKYAGVPDVANANSWGYQVLTRLAVAANSPSTLVKGDSLVGSAFTNNVLSCMTVAGYVPGTDFAPALGATGLFGVRSDARTAAVVSRAILDGAPLFGAERADDPSSDPKVQYGQWNAVYTPPAPATSSSYTGPILFYGYKLPSEQAFFGETPVGATFDLSALPAPLSFLHISANLADTVPALRAGICSMTSAGQILHDHGGAAILPQTGDPLFCNSPPAPSYGMVESSPISSFALATQRVMSWFTPQPLMAYFVRIGGSGSYGGLSKGGAVNFTVPASGITFSQQPLSGKLNAPDQFPKDIAVKVQSLNGNAIARVKVSLTVAGNSGSFSPPSDSVRYTNLSGIATFPNFHLDKSGGYTITARLSMVR